MNTFKHFRNPKLVLQTGGGENIYKCLREAMITALTNDVDVEFTHNERLYLINPVHLVDLANKPVNEYVGTDSRGA